MPIRPFQSGDEAAIVEIYNHYISHTTITFEEVPLSARMGFKQVAHFAEVGRKFGQWLDVGHWQITRQA